MFSALILTKSCKLPVQTDWVRKLLILKRARNGRDESPLICDCGGFINFGGSKCKLKYNPMIHGELCTCGILARKLKKLEKSLDCVLEVLDKNTKHTL